MGHYIDRFADELEDVTEDNLHVLANHDLLKNIGIVSALDRLKIILQIQRHKPGMKGTQECSVEKVTGLLRKTGMEQYAPYFEQKEIDCDLLLAATDEILQELGIDSAFDRLKIRINFRRELRGGPSPLAQKYPVDAVVALLKENNMDAKYQLIIEKCDIDGELLTEASDQVLQEIGIKSRIQQRNIKQLIQK